MFCLEIDLPVPLTNLLFDLCFLPGESEGFQFAMGRTSTVCSALSTFVPQGISNVSWIVSQLGLLSRKELLAEC